jgi:outer membrane protein OmpA-like peptidoglycan-associated protein
VDAVATEVAATRRLITSVERIRELHSAGLTCGHLPTRVDQIDQLKANPQNVFIEIEGHTDNVGDTAINERLGMDRAEAVKRYLYEQHQVPLHKMNVISYGEDKPVAPNTRDGRAQYRRVVVKVLS